MPHGTPLITTIVAALVVAFVFGFAALRLRLPPIVGYLLAGVALGPFTPGYVADAELTTQLAELGVILLMFGVGLHFSLADLMSVRRIAIPGAIGQMAVASAAGVGLSLLMGWGIGAGIMFGLALSVASTVVLLRALEERNLVTSPQGRIAVGWLIVEDLAMVVALVLIPPLAGLMGGSSPPVNAESAAAASALGIGVVSATLALTAAKVAAFVALMLVVGRRVIPWLLFRVQRTGSEELFRLAVLATALGVAYGATMLFGVSFALGAFFAGMVMAGSDLSTRATIETLPLRDAFAVLFFVSVGMLFDPFVLVRAPLPLLATVAIILVVKTVAAYGIVRGFGHSRQVALTIAASLSQIGEFSFILAVMGTDLGILTEEASDLLLAGALISILLNPVTFWLLDKWGESREPAPDAGPAATTSTAAAPEAAPGPTGAEPAPAAATAAPEGAVAATSR